MSVTKLSEEVCLFTHDLVFCVALLNIEELKLVCPNKLCYEICTYGQSFKIISLQKLSVAVKINNKLYILKYKNECFVKIREFNIDPDFQIIKYLNKSNLLLIQTPDSQYLFDFYKGQVVNKAAKEFNFNEFLHANNSSDIVNLYLE